MTKSEAFAVSNLMYVAAIFACLALDVNSLGVSEH